MEPETYDSNVTGGVHRVEGEGCGRVYDKKSEGTYKFGGYT